MRPSVEEEAALLRQGYRLVAGADEVGRGALAGPVVAAAVILPFPLSAPWVAEVRDSKLLSAPQRESLYGPITQAALGVGVGIVPPEVIDSQGILPATCQAVAQALACLSPAPDFLLVDWLKLPAFPLPYKPIVKGDRSCLSIACASIVAKVTRDRLMKGLDRLYPGYDFSQHKGYGTPGHRRCLEARGPCPAHRRSFTLLPQP